MKTRMRNPIVALALLALFTLNLQLSTAHAQGTAFTYQGRLNSGGSPASGLYDFRFRLDADPAGNTILATVVTNAIGVTNGLFVTAIDFGPGFYNGSNYWLEVGVKTNLAGGYTQLNPFQPLTPTPYAVFAITASNVSGTISAAQLSGMVPSANLTGTYGNALTLNNAGNSFTGNGSGLTSLNASQLTSGTVADARLAPDVALTDASQTFTGVNTFNTGTGAGRLTVYGETGIDTSLFSGLGLQYTASTGEGAIMSSYNNGFGFLSFYTKQGVGYPIAKQVVIDRLGNVAIDQQNNNSGTLNDGTTNGVGLTFGVGSGEGIASQRQTGPGVNQYGLDFYTDFTKRMSINNSGFVGIGTQTQILGDEQFGMYSSTTNSFDGMYIGTAAGGRPFYGFYEGGFPSVSWTEINGQQNNNWELWLNNSFTMAVTTNGLVGIGTTTPASALEVANGDVRVDDNRLLLAGGGDTNSGLILSGGLPGIFAGNGPFLFGYNGGALGAVAPTTVCLSWDYLGDVWVSNNLATASLTIHGGTTFNCVQDGIFTAGPSGTNYNLIAGYTYYTKEVTNAFATAFSSAPNVTVSAVSQAGTDWPDVYCLTVRRVTTTNLVVNIQRVDSNAGWAQSLRVSYHAWQ